MREVRRRVNPLRFLMGLYLDNGYLNIDWLRGKGKPFVFITAARGTGKTYGSIKSVLTSGERFIFMRRTATQVDLIRNPNISPFKKVCQDLGMEYKIESLSKNLDSIVIDGDHRGYLMALSTMSNMRGFEDPEVRSIVYDEFIPQPQERLIKDEYGAFLNAYETLNRNRELEGQEPIQVIASSNSNNILNPIYIGLKLVETVDKMIRKDIEVWDDKKRGMLLVYPMHSAISEQKAHTALYQLSGDTEYAGMALRNDFNINTMGTVQPKPIREYRPLVRVGELSIYVHKSKNEYYVTTHGSGSPAEYASTDDSLAIFRSRYDYLWMKYCFQHVYFEKYVCEGMFRVYFGKRS